MKAGFLGRFFFSLAALLGGVVTQAETAPLQPPNPPLLVCTTFGYAPFEVKDRNGNPVGFDVTMLQSFADSIKRELKFLDLKWDSAIPTTAAGKCDLLAAGMSVTTERRKVLLFTHPYYENGVYVGVGEKGSHIKSLADLDQKDMRVAVKVGTTASLLLNTKYRLKKAKLLEYSENGDVINAFVTGRATAIAYDESFLVSMAKTYKHPIHLLQPPLAVEPIALGTHKNNQKLVDQFNEFLVQWKKSGEYEKAVKLFFDGDEWRRDL